MAASTLDTLATASATGGDVSTLVSKAKKKAKTPQEQAKLAGKEFEQVFLSNMLGHMFQGLKGEGPLGGNDNATSTWRSFLTDEYAKKITQSGGIGIASQVTRELLRVQEGAK